MISTFLVVAKFFVFIETPRVHTNHSALVLDNFFYYPSSLLKIMTIVLTSHCVSDRLYNLTVQIKVVLSIFFYCHCVVLYLKRLYIIYNSLNNFITKLMNSMLADKRSEQDTIRGNKWILETVLPDNN